MLNIANVGGFVVKSLPFPSPGDLPNLRIKPGSPALQVDSCTGGGFFTNWAMREIQIKTTIRYYITSMRMATWKKKKTENNKCWQRCGMTGVLVHCWWECRVVAQMVKRLSTVQETWVQSLSWEDPLEEGMATHSSVVAWKIPWTEEPGSLQSMGSQRVGHDWATSLLHFASLSVKYYEGSAKN